MPSFGGTNACLIGLRSLVPAKLPLFGEQIPMRTHLTGKGIANYRLIVMLTISLSDKARASADLEHFLAMQDKDLSVW